MIIVGDQVTWTSQSQGTAKTKTGVVLAVIPKNRDGHKILDKLVGPVSTGQLKFQDYNIVSDRILVEVPRGGRSQLNDYYAPYQGVVKKVES